MSRKQQIDILEKLGLSELSEEEQQEMLIELQDLVFKGSLVRILEQMDEKTRTLFDSLMENGASEEIVEAFIEKHVPHAGKAIEDTIAELKNDILAVVGK